MLEPDRCEGEGDVSGHPNIFEVRGASKFFPVRQTLLSRLSSRVPPVRAVDSVSLEVRQGEVLGIIGESGSGKTTLGFMLADLEPMSAGEILYKSKSLQQMTRTERRLFRQKVQVVFQDSGSSLNPRRTIGGTLRDSLRLSGLRSRERDSAVAELLGKVGLSAEYGHRYPHELSGGQRQRVGLARALAMRPDLIIADEPVSALDVSLQGQIINLLLGLQREMNLTMVLISHDIAVVRHSCQRVAVMYEGKLVEVGDVSQVVFEPRHPYTKRLIAAVPKGFDSSSTAKPYQQAEM
jgi:peptide/nickel transport system ATP-binding protein